MNTTAAPDSASVENLLSQITDEFLQRLDAGEQPDIEEYAHRYPAIAEVLRQVLPALQVLRGPASVTDAADVAPAGCLGDFRILREIGRGGMGIVYEAEQMSLRRRVALKVLPFAATMDPRHLRRFQNEAQATAGLHHTNIVPVYSVGCERGVHYYAMQFIDGQPLHELIQQLRRAEKTAPAVGEEQTVAYQASSEEASTAAPTVRAADDATPRTNEGKRGREYFHRVAEWGVQAAEALDHAHQLGIVHRDVKPANLLLDSRGNLWVTDFGLALVQRGEAGLTMTGDLVGTLRYMSPEQALAKRVVIDHRTDVYSLGATLYELLTLRPAFASEDRQELLRQIAYEDPLRPCRLERTIPAELEIIVLKAMEKRPQDRYATAQELAEDLRHWLNDMPIRARRPTLLQHAAKWMRRHRALARAAVGFLVLAVFLLSTSTWMIWRANQETKAALARADAKSRWARQAVNDMYTDVAEKWLARQPRLQPLQRAFLEKALRYYQEATETDDESPESQRDLAHAYLRISKIQFDLGAYREAEQACRRAVEVRERLTSEEPKDRIQLAVAWGRLSGALLRLGRHSEAEEAARKAITLYEQAADGPNSPGDRSLLASCYHCLGMTLELAGALPAAEEAHRKALQIKEELCAQEPAEPQHQADRARTLQSLGSVLLASQRFQLAVEVMERGADAAERAAKADPGAVRYQMDLASLRLSLAIVYWKAGQLAKAEKALRGVVQAQSRVVSDYPDIPRYREELGSAYNILSLVYGDLGRPKESEEACRESIRIKEKLVDEVPSNPLYREDLIHSLNNLIPLLVGSGRLREAERTNADARRHAERLVKDFRESPNFRKDLARTYQGRAKIDLVAGQPAAAAAAWKQALEISDHPDIRDGAAEFLVSCPDPKYRDPVRAVALARENVRIAKENTGYWETLGRAEYRAGHAAEAVKALEQAGRSGSTSAQDRLWLAMARWAVGDRERARREYHAARKQIGKEREQDPETRALLAEAAELFASGSAAAPPKTAAADRANKN